MDRGGFGLDIAGLSTAGGAVALILLIVGLWEQKRPARPESEPAAPRWAANIALFVIGEAAWRAIAPIAAFGASAYFGIGGEHAGLGLNFLLMLVALDAGEYLLHRLQHRFGWLWRLHAIHHCDTDPDITTTLRHHPGETLVMGGAFTGFSLLIGASPAEIAAYGVVAFGVQFLGHANVALPPALERALSGAVVTPDFHRLHHSRDMRQSDANYGQVLTIWDRLLGTRAPRDSGNGPAAFGVEDYLAPRFGTVSGMLLQPFGRAPGLARRAQ